jgi:hypothetical protein
MTTLIQILKPVQIAETAAERFSFRVQDGVEIYEHESRQACTVPVTTGTRGGIPTPRLIVAELARVGIPFLTRTRSEIAGLNALLRTAMGVR